MTENVNERPEELVQDNDNAAEVEKESAETTTDNSETTTGKEVTPETTTSGVEDEAHPTSRREVLAQKREDEARRAKNNEIREKNRINWMQLQSAQHENRILSSTIISVETLNENIVVCTVMFNGFRIIIPCAEMYVSPPVDMSTVHNDTERVRREKQILSKLLGAEIPFIITNIQGSPEKDDYAIVASRKSALTKTAARNFNRRGREGHALIEEGDIVEATIVSVGRHAVWANVQGMDVSIPIYLLTHKFIGNAADVYHPGEKLNVYIRNVEYDDKGHATRIVASGREPEIQGFIPKLKRITSGANYLARITSIRKSRADESRTVITLFLEDVGVPGFASYMRIDTMAVPPCTGDKVVFSAYRVDEERGVVIGSIMRRC